MVDIVGSSSGCRGSGDGPGPVCFQVAGWVADPASGEMRRGAETVRVEPKVMELLVYLAAHQGEVVTREELERTVWAGTVVSYDALSGSVRKLRRALGDDARPPCLLETLSKRGYRLVAPVVPVHEADEDGGPADGHSMTGQAPPSGPWVLGVGLGLWVTLMVATGVLAWLRPWGLAPKPAATALAPGSILVVPFADLSARPGPGLLAEGISDHLITILAANPALSVGTGDAPSLGVGRGTQVPQTSGGLDVRYILRGSVDRSEGGVRIHVELLDGRTGTPSWTGLFEAPMEDISRLQDQIARSIDSVLTRKTQGAAAQ